MKRIAFALSLIAFPLFAADDITGRWEGTSICAKIEGNESCHDENVRYDIVPSQTTKGGVTMDAQKLVNGKYQSMGLMEFTWNATAKQWESRFKMRRLNQEGMWTFKAAGNHILGECVLL